jgi:NAD(P)-dependent dehydrogenase (short-subunit alcohol dehydrogenase family)
MPSHDSSPLAGSGMKASHAVLLITGASRGIGAQVALLAAQQGYAVAVNYEQQHGAAQALCDQINALPSHAPCMAVQANVADELQVRAMFDEVRHTLGPVRYLVNNAGVVDVASKVADMSVARWRRMFDVNVLGTFLCAREAVLQMQSVPLRPGQPRGAIVNVSSVAARLGSPGQYVDYASAKAAVDTFTLGLARELAPDGIRVNAVRPGIIDTEIHASGGQPQRVAQLGPQQPMGRAGTALEVAQSIVWLLSNQASYVTGSILDVAGGR